MAKGDFQKAYLHFLRVYNIDAEFTISHEKFIAARNKIETTFVTAGE